MIIPSIDLMDGKAVQLVRGKQKVLEVEDVLGLAREFNKYGEVALIDLDAALGQGDNLDLIQQICQIADCRVGGGIRSIKRAEKILGFGAKKIIIGTKANPDFLSNFSSERLIVAIDSIGDDIVVKGWKETNGEKTHERIENLEPYCSEFLFTDVNREGLMDGINLKKIRYISSLTLNKVTIAGGITTIQDIQNLVGLNVNAQIGMAIYTNNLDLTEATTSILDFKKSDGLIPTIVQNTAGNVLMLAYSSVDSLKIAFQTSTGTYYSRSRKEIWTKGKTSGNTQELVKVRYDCDRDTLLFTVKQRGNACHKEEQTCFTDINFSLNELYSVIVSRSRSINIDQEINQLNIDNSYTSKILKDSSLLLDKIKEEALEVVEFTDRENLIWEIADLTYFVMVLMVKNNVNISDIKNELWRRRK